MKTALFDTWTDRYDAWFETPTGQLVKKYELDLLFELLQPQPGEYILDAGCGTGIFTRDILRQGVKIAGMDLSLPMVARGAQSMTGKDFFGLAGDMCALPFRDNCFDRAFSMTAIEFIPDAAQAVNELNRVVKRGGTVVVTTLNSLSPWAERRRKKAGEGHSLFQEIIFRSPEELRRILPGQSVIKTAIHFQKDDDVEKIPGIEDAGRNKLLDTGAFLAAQWIK